MGAEVLGCAGLRKVLRLQVQSDHRSVLQIQRFLVPMDAKEGVAEGGVVAAPDCRLDDRQGFPRPGLDEPVGGRDDARIGEATDGGATGPGILCQLEGVRSRVPDEGEGPAVVLVLVALDEVEAAVAHLPVDAGGANVDLDGDKGAAIVEHDIHKGGGRRVDQVTGCPVVRRLLQDLIVGVLEPLEQVHTTLPAKLDHYELLVKR